MYRDICSFVIMDHTPSSSSGLADSVKNMAISRRGGVRTRGGRLPPISMREIAQVTVKKESKVIAPIIPQRRRIVKQEVEIKTEPDRFMPPGSASQYARGQGRGRQPKVFLQTEGTFLAEGPAAKIKRDPLFYQSLSFSRSSRAAAAAAAASEGSELKCDTEIIEELLESYEEYGEYENDHDTKPPYRLPLPKENLYPEIKAEPKKKGFPETEKIKIKEEIKSEIVEIKKEIISDSEEDDADSSKIDVGQTEVKSFKTEVKNFKTEVKSYELFQNVKADAGRLILLQMPSYAPMPEAETFEGPAKESKNKVEIEKSEEISTFIDHLEEGHVGKLQMMKSGRMQLKLGSAEFELLDGSASETYLEAVSIQMRDGTGDLSVLGGIEKKLILSPVLNMLLTKDKTIGCKT